MREPSTQDILAIVFQDRVHQMLLWISVSVLAAFVSFELFAHIWESPILLGAYLVILVIPWLSYFLIVKPRDWQGKYLDYRALAEALRVQFFWRMAGIPLSAADFYLRRQTGDLTWIRHAARACNIGPVPDVRDADVGAVRKHWIADQSSYFDETAGREEHTFMRWNKRLMRAYLVGIIIASGVLIALLTNAAMTGLPLHISMVVMGLAPAVAATIGYVLEHRAYESHIRQYDLMADLYGSAEEALGEATDLRNQPAIIEAIGREALAENGDWYFMHRERRVAPPKGG